MKKNNRSFIVFNEYSRARRIWRFFFTGWGLIMVGALVAGAVFTREILWTPISVINMQDVMSNQFKITDASFAGIDDKGDPFTLKAISAKQGFKNPDIIFAEQVSGSVIRIAGDKKILDNILADSAEYDRAKKQITFIGNVRVDSDNGDKIRTDKLIIKI